jgi:hypothetical protein
MVRRWSLGDAVHLRRGDRDDALGSALPVGQVMHRVHPGLEGEHDEDKGEPGDARTPA